MRLTEESDQESRKGVGGPSAPSDGTLLRRVAAGDREAFKALYERYQRRLFCYLVKMVNDQGRAEELTNDVLLEVWRGAKTYQGRSSPSTWIFGIARHKALNELRRKGDVPVEPEALLQVTDPHPGPGHEVERADLARLMKAALTKLGPEHREVLELAYYQGFSIQEMAEILRCPANTVKTRMFYARQKLKEILPAMGVEER